MIKCEYCNLHKKTAKYCLKKQKKSFENEKDENENICKFCEKSFSINYIKTHMISCYAYLQHRIKELENLLLEKDLENKKLFEEIIKLQTENTLLKEERIEDRNK